MSEKNISAIKTGAILGIIGIILTQIVYIVDVSMLADWKLSIGSLVIGVVVLVILGKKYRNEHMEGFMSFGQAYGYSFLALITSGLISLFFLMLLYNVIDPEVPEIIVDKALENTESFMRKLGTPDEAIDEAMEQMEKDMPESFTIAGQLKNSWGLLIYAGIFALIGGAIIKKSRPEFEE